MIRSGDNRQGVCPVKFLQEVWQHSEVACQADYTCNCLNRTQQPVINKIYYPNPSTAILQNNNNNNVWVNTQTTKKNLNSSNMFQYYYNNINNNLTKNNALFVKQINLNNNNDYPNFHAKNEHKNVHTKAPFSSSKRPLSIRLSTPKHVSNFFSRTFRSDSQKRPLLLSYGSICDVQAPNFQIIPKKSGLKISSIYTISENVEKFSLKTPLYRKNLYISSNSRPLFVRK